MAERQEKYAEEYDRQDASPFAEWIGIERLLVERDHVILKLRQKPELGNVYGFFHGGVLFALADHATGTAAHTDGRDYVTLNSDFHFIANIKDGYAVCEARVQHRGRKTVVVDCDIRSGDNTLLSTGKFTFFCVREA